MTPTSLRFVGVGPAYAASIMVSQANYGGTFTLGGSSCAGIASADATTSGGTFTITPVSTGSCSYTITGAGTPTTLSVTVTTVTVGGQ